jgi:hypothetical protein
VLKPSKPNIKRILIGYLGNKLLEPKKRASVGLFKLFA